MNNLRMVKNSKKKPWIIGITILVLIFGGVFSFDLIKALIVKKIFSNYVVPPQVVSTVTVQGQDWQPILPAVGELSADTGVDISPETSGRVTAIYFTSGQYVKKGDKLIQLDDSAETAQLESALAQLQNSETNLQRIAHLYEQKTVSQSSYDDAVSTHKQLQANYENLLALKGKKLLRAPFAGKVGIAQVSVGQNVNFGQICVSLQTNDAMDVEFAVSQKDFASLSLGETIEVFVDSYPNQKFIGHISAFNSQFNEETRTIDVEATLDPTNVQLLSGMFVNVKILLPVQHDVLVVPQTTLTYTLYGESAYVVIFDKVQKEPRVEGSSGKDTSVIATDKNGYQLGTAKKIFVKTGDKRENSVVVVEGLKAGDVVVDAGQIKIDDGSKVAINNSVQPTEQ